MSKDTWDNNNQDLLRYYKIMKISKLKFVQKSDKSKKRQYTNTNKDTWDVIRWPETPQLVQIIISGPRFGIKDLTSGIRDQGPAFKDLVSGLKNKRYKFKNYLNNIYLQFTAEIFNQNKHI